MVDKTLVPKFEIVEFQNAKGEKCYLHLDKSQIFSLFQSLQSRLQIKSDLTKGDTHGQPEIS